MIARLVFEEALKPKEGFFPVLGYCAGIIDASKAPRGAVVLFEYVILAGCVVIAVFNPGYGVTAALTGAVSAIRSAIVAAAGT